MRVRKLVLPVLAIAVAGLAGGIGGNLASNNRSASSLIEDAASPAREPAAPADVTADGALFLPASDIADAAAPDATRAIAVAAPENLPKAPRSGESVADLETETDSLADVLAYTQYEAAVEAERSVEESLERRIVEVDRGDTLMKLLIDAAVPQAEAHEAISALRDVFDPRTLKPGQQISVLFEQASGDSRFVGLELEPNVERSVSVARTDGATYEATTIEKPLEVRTIAASGVIESSLFEAGAGADVPIPIMIAAIRAFSYDVDFQRDVHPGDRFEVLYERYFTEEGAPARDGDVLYASLTLSGKELPLYRFTGKDGVVDYFNPRGESVRKALLRTPIDGARISSKFGMRRHPILGYGKMHKGVDFAAPTGTPIYAAGDGVIEEIGRKGAYGNYVRVRHNAQISTAYAHLSRFAKGKARGSRVRQGDVIGYVGSTGRSTGPHLHFEVLKGGRQINPMSVDLPTGRVLAGQELEAFKATVRELDRTFSTLNNPVQLARTTAGSAVNVEETCTQTVTC